MQPFPLHLSSLNFPDDGSGESASAGENGRISERRRRNKKRVGNNKKKNESGNKTCQGNVFNFIMDHRIDVVFQKWESTISIESQEIFIPSSTFRLFSNKR